MYVSKRISFQEHYAQSLLRRLAYIRIPEGEKRGKRDKDKQPKAERAMNKMTFPTCKSPMSEYSTDDKPGHERNVKKLQQVCRGGQQKEEVGSKIHGKCMHRWQR